MRPNKPHMDENGQWKSERNLALQHRTPWVDYTTPGTYMLTLCTNERKPIFGRLIIPNNKAEQAYIELSPLGQMVAKEWQDIATHEPDIIIQDYQIMPDHLHGIIYVRNHLNRPLGQIVRGFKMHCTSIYRALMHDDLVKPIPQSGMASLNIHQRHKIAQHSLWESNYNDRVAYTQERHETLQAYIHDNPRRLAIKKLHSDYFTLMRDITLHTQIGGLSFTALGNLQLLAQHDKQVIQCSRNLTDRNHEQEYRALMHDYVRHASTGVVSISAAISKGEQQICRKIRESGFPLIILMKDGFPHQDNPQSRYYKPGGVLFDACANGTLLLLEPTGDVFDIEEIADVVSNKAGVLPHDSLRYRFLALNEVARLISDDGSIIPHPIAH